MVVHRRHKLSLFRKLKIACFGILFTILDIFMLSIKALFLPNSITAVCCLGLAIFRYSGVVVFDCDDHFLKNLAKELKKTLSY